MVGNYFYLWEIFLFAPFWNFAIIEHHQLYPIISTKTFISIIYPCQKITAKGSDDSFLSNCSDERGSFVFLSRQEYPRIFRMHCRPVCIIPIPTWIWRYWQIRTSWCGFCSKMTSDVSRGYSYHFWIFFPAFATTVRNASGRAERGQAVREAVTIRQGWLGGRTEGRKIGEMMRGLVLLS